MIASIRKTETNQIIGIHSQVFCTYDVQSSGAYTIGPAGKLVKEKFLHNNIKKKS